MNHTIRKNSKYKRKTPKNRKRMTQKKLLGGKKRVEKILISFEKQHTSPNIKSKIRVIKGPTAYKGKGKDKIGYLVNFVASTANEFEEELAQIMKGIPKMVNKQKEYELIFYDNDAPLQI